MFPVVGTTAVLVNNFEGVYDAQVNEGEIYLFASLNSELPESKITISIVKNNVMLKGDEGEYFRTVFQDNEFLHLFYRIETPFIKNPEN